jgi:hypothetical protein
MGKATLEHLVLGLIGRMAEISVALVFPAQQPPKLFSAMIFRLESNSVKRRIIARLGPFQHGFWGRAEKGRG